MTFLSINLHNELISPGQKKFSFNIVLDDSRCYSDIERRSLLLILFKMLEYLYWRKATFLPQPYSGRILRQKTCCYNITCSHHLLLESNYFYFSNDCCEGLLHYSLFFLFYLYSFLHFLIPFLISLLKDFFS